MFENLVESGSHKADLSRKGSFLFVTISIYVVVIVSFLVGTIWFTKVAMDTSDLELTTLVAPIPPTIADKAPEKQEVAKPQKIDQNVDVRQKIVAANDRPDLVPEKVSNKASDVPPVRRGVVTQVGSDNSNAAAPMSSGPGTGNVTTAPAHVVIADEPPPPPPKPTPHAPISGGVLNGKALHLVQPQYPQIAKQAHASGTVVVQVLIDENGNVIAAHAVSGHPLLQPVAVAAARASKFSPTKLSGQPVQVNGLIQYNFVAQ
jgi:protein TonB